ncbi:MAG TPA: 30S ribosomal protein S27ae [Candidatus Nitrosocosmicus sp.]
MSKDSKGSKDSKDSKGSKEISVSKYYKIEGDKIERLKRECPRCGKGIFMADNKDRFTCGKCGYTEFKKDHKKSKMK